MNRQLWGARRSKTPRKQRQIAIYTNECGHLIRIAATTASQQRLVVAVSNRFKPINQVRCSRKLSREIAVALSGHSHRLFQYRSQILLPRSHSRPGVLHSLPWHAMRGDDSAPTQSHPGWRLRPQPLPPIRCFRARHFLANTQNSTQAECRDVPRLDVATGRGTCHNNSYILVENTTHGLDQMLPSLMQCCPSNADQYEIMFSEYQARSDFTALALRIWREMRSIHTVFYHRNAVCRNA